MSDVQWTNAGLLDKILAELQKMTKVLAPALRYPRGTTFTSVVHLRTGEPVTRIDFLGTTSNRNIPVTDFITQYGVPISRLLVYNNGPGNIFFDTNRNFNDNMTTTPLAPNASYDIDADQPSIASINMVAKEDNAEIILTAII